MKKLSLISTAIALTLALLLFGCESTPTNTSPAAQSQQTSPTSQESQAKGSGFHIYQVNNDGTSQEITDALDANVATQQNKPTLAAGTKGMIITDKGFLPNTLTIKAGTKVVFENRDSKEHWPASDPHPTHTLCPGFDAKKGLTTNESYEFTFDKAETCTFHDHLNPNLKGKIVVE